MAPTSLIKDIAKCKHPNSRKTLALAKKAKRFNNRTKIKLGHAVKSNILGEKFNWFTQAIGDRNYPLTKTEFDELITMYLKRFDNEVEQINLKQSISKSRSKQHGSRLDIIRMTMEREVAEYNGGGIGHAGHDEPPATSLRKVPPLRGNEHKYDLDAQVKHKLEFIETYVPNDVKIHLIGHSIGAWMIVQMLKSDPTFCNRIQHSYMLFPTIERMAVSPNGFFFTKIFQPLWFLLRFLVMMFSMLPVFFQVFIFSIYFWLSSIPRYFIGTALKYSRLSIIEKVLYLANEEMKRVVELDPETLETLRKNHQILKFYYGASDGWTPKKYFHQLKQKIPELDIEIDNRNINHAFVLKSSVEVGRLVAEWIMCRRRY